MGPCESSKPKAEFVETNGKGSIYYYHNKIVVVIGKDVIKIPIGNATNIKTLSYILKIARDYISEKYDEYLSGNDRLSVWIEKDILSLNKYTLRGVFSEISERHFPENETLIIVEKILLLEDFIKANTPPEVLREHQCLKKQLEEEDNGGNA